MPAPPREATYRKVEHPEYLPDGRTLWVAPEVQEISRQLREGAPELGWAGDPRLAIYRGEKADRWEVWRLEADGEYRRAMISKPGASLLTLIPWLVAHDTHRGYSAADEVTAHNLARERAVDERSRERLLDALDRVAFSIQKDVGIQTDIGPGSWSEETSGLSSKDVS